MTLHHFFESVTTMAFHIQQEERVLLLALFGEINVDEVQTILKTLSEINLSDTTYCVIDCREAVMVYTDIASSVKLLKQANHCGIKFVLVGISQWVNVARSMLVSDDYVPLFHTLADALQYTQSSISG